MLYVFDVIYAMGKGINLIYLEDVDTRRVNMYYPITVSKTSGGLCVMLCYLSS